MSLVRAENVRKEYVSGDGPVAALKDICLTIDAGEFVGVVGPSGSGKSTLLGILGGLNPPSTGRVLVDDMDIYQLHPERRADFRNQYVGFVFQEFQLLPYLTACQNVMLPLAIGRMPRRQQREMAEEALARVGLTGKRNRLPHQLSGGEQQRVAIARAVVNQPPILLADEPTGALDSQTGQEIMEIFAALNQKGQCIVMVTHNTENLKYTDRVFCLRDGVISQHVTGKGGRYEAS
ncbi:MAG TPA: ABC transporter ATP-binding protein [Firmicutes bacterium]|nr:ABC transporter ATP-binding protein [Bacillota bacterium]